MNKFKFSNGLEVGIKRVSPMLAVELARKFPKPKPPMKQVKYGDEISLEPNPADPEYLATLEEWQVQQELRTQSMYIRRGVVIELTDAQRKELAELRQFWKDEYGMELDKDDKYAYITYIAMEGGEDIGGLLSAIAGVSRPTEEAIEAAVDSFQDNVPES